ncbi:MAG: hypothetical protein ACRDV9_10385 [Acidimicrobiia bacterium]
MLSPIDPHTGAKQAITGRVVTMDDGSRVVDRGVVYIDHGRIVDVADREAPPPAGFEETGQTASGGTIFPGLIELHNHLAYNVLRLWPVPRKYTNRAQWGGGGNDDYRRPISGPMRVLGTDENLLAAVVRFVECQALMAGVTTTQGVALYSNQGARRYYRGVVRNVEQTDDPLTVADDASYLAVLGAQGNLPPGFFQELTALYA